MFDKVMYIYSILYKWERYILASLVSYFLYLKPVFLIESFRNEPRHEKTDILVPTWSDSNQAVQLQKMATGLKFRIYKVEGLYYLCSENKGADQLHGYREADLRLCFRICKMLVFS